MKVRLLCILVALTLTLLLSACTTHVSVGTPPEEHVNSYEEIQAALVQYSDMSFPDISFYEENCNLKYIVGINMSNSKLKIGYSIYSANTPLPQDLLEGKPVLYSFGISATDLANYHNELNKPPVLTITRTYRGVPLSEEHKDISGPEYEDKVKAWLGYEPDFPLNNFRAFITSYEFDLDGCRYRLWAQVNLLHDESDGVSNDELMVPYREELFAVLDSILDERGVEK